MHKTKLIQRGVKSTPKYFLGGMFSTLFGTPKTTPNAVAQTTPPAGKTTAQAGINQDYTNANKPAGLDLNKAISSGLGGLLSGITGLQSLNNSGLNSDQKRMMGGDLAVDTLSQIGGMIPGVGGVIAGGLGALNRIGGALIGTPKAIKDFKLNDRVSTSSGYGGIAANANDTMNSANTYKNAGLVGKLFGGKGKISGKTNVANQQAQVVTKLLDQNKLAMDQMGSADLNNQRNSNKLYGGNSWNNGSILYGERGGTLTISGSNGTKTYEQYKKFLSAAAKLNFKKINVMKTPPTAKELLPIKRHAEGGVIEAPKNVIVDGALHARNHSLKEVEDLQDAAITLKGIPVVSIAEGGEITQHAEIECDELILHYDCSKELEKLYEEGDEESMIAAGKLLAKELVKNTKDSSNKILTNA